MIVERRFYVLRCDGCGWTLEEAFESKWCVELWMDGKRPIRRAISEIMDKIYCLECLDKIAESKPFGRPLPVAAAIGGGGS